MSKKELRAPTGSVLMDMVLGGNKDVFGIEFGTIYNLVGDSSSGKTFTATEMIAAARSVYGKKLKWNFDNGENGNKLDTTALYGFNVLNDESLRSATIEDFHGNIKKFLKTLKETDVGIYVLDSLDSITSEDTQERADERQKAFEKGKDFKEGSYMMAKPKYMSQELFPDITPLIEVSNCILVIISQVRENIGVSYGPKYKRNGGKALDFYSHNIAWLAIAEKLSKTVEGELVTYGVRGKIKTTKSRSPRPFREAYYTILFDYGVDDLSSNVEYVFKLVTDTGKSTSGASSMVSYREFSKAVPEVDREKFFKKFCDTSATKDQLKKIDQLKDAEGEKSWWLEKSDLINFITENDLEAAIRNAAINKWERIESEIKTVRKPKY